MGLYIQRRQDIRGQELCAGMLSTTGERDGSSESTSPYSVTATTTTLGPGRPVVQCKEVRIHTVWIAIIGNYSVRRKRSEVQQYGRRARPNHIRTHCSKGREAEKLEIVGRSTGWFVLGSGDTACTGAIAVMWVVQEPRAARIARPRPRSVRRAVLLRTA